MKALTIRQPWAWAIFHAGKNVENRTWMPPRWIIGQRIAIHASGALRDDEIESFITFVAQRHDRLGAVDLPIWENLVCGAIIGTVMVRDCIHWTIDLTECARRYPWWTGDKDGSEVFGWVLTEPRLLPEPIPMRGALGLWDVPAGIMPEKGE